MRKRGLFSVLVSNFFRNISITAWLIIINIFLFITSLFLGNYLNYLVLQPRLLFQNYYIWTLITSMFLHAGFAHLFFNMFSLYFIGSFIEKIAGRKRFLYFYLISGVIAGLFFAILAYFLGFGLLERVFGSPSITAVGASGAIFGLLGILAVLTPRKKVYLIAGPLAAIIIQVLVESFITSSSALTFVNLIVSVYFIFSIFAIFSFSRKFLRFALPLELEFWFLPFVAIVPLVIIGLFIPLPIGNTAHLGGLIAGLVYGVYLRKKYAKKIVMLNRMIR